MPPLLGFTDEEMDMITALASPLPPSARDRFLKLVAGKLSGYPPEVRGAALAHRIAGEVRRNFLNVAVGARGKWRSRRGRRSLARRPTPHSKPLARRSSSGLKRRAAFPKAR